MIWFSYMRENVAELVLHPVRLRILQAFIGGRTLAAEDLDAELGDVPKATLYRQLATLAGALLAVVEERPARGTPRRIYALVQGAAAIGPDDLAAATPEDHLRFFTVFWATVPVPRPGAGGAS
jgi:DNA-binding transcriptional ArsR family regulator